MSETKLCIQTVNTFNIGGNIHYCMNKISGINAATLLYRSNVYVLYMSM